jgi:hypothetical protein
LPALLAGKDFSDVRPSVALTLAAASGQMDKGAVTAFFQKHLKIPEN